MLYLYAALIGLLSGLTSGLFGVGGGIVMVPAMAFLLKLDFKVAVGTSLAVMVPSALMGAIKHYDLGHVNFKVALAIIPVALLCSFGGAWLTENLSSAVLKRGFGGLLLLVGIRMLLSSK
ncbi:MAG: sulfite exporter TauE/SafE family protein [Verrucomicrobiales bacterium]|nr:sulfite exporter TauE/SafE family protein [Verrucomicrobiales bacterium]